MTDEAPEAHRIGAALLDVGCFGGFAGTSAFSVADGSTILEVCALVVDRRNNVELEREDSGRPCPAEGYNGDI